MGTSSDITAVVFFCVSYVCFVAFVVSLIFYLIDKRFSEYETQRRYTREEWEEAERQLERDGERAARTLHDELANQTMERNRR